MYSRCRVITTDYPTTEQATHEVAAKNTCVAVDVVHPTEKIVKGD